MLDEQRFGGDGPSTARPEQAGDCYDKVDEKYGDITHHQTIVTNMSYMTRLGIQRHSIQNTNSHPTGNWVLPLVSAAE
jgi:hypothetical protein